LIGEQHPKHKNDWPQDSKELNYPNSFGTFCTGCHIGVKR